MAQLVTRVPDRLVSEIDALVAEGVVVNRSQAVRLALEEMFDRRRREEIGRQIVEAYRRQPQHDDESFWGDQGARQMIEEEPW